MECVYTSYDGMAFGVVQILPYIVPTAITLGSFTRDVAGRRGFEFTTFWYSFYLTACQIALSILQLSVRASRSDPFCFNVIAPAFPSSSTFFVVAGVTFIIMMTFIYNMVFGWKYWLYLFFIMFLPPLYLVWVQYNTWWEILVSGLLAVVANLFFFFVLEFWVAPDLPFWLNCAPNTWMGVTDTFIMTEEQVKLREHLFWEYHRIDHSSN